MERVELMQVEDTFMIESIGLVLAPFFELPPEGKWENITDKVSIQAPDGREFLAEALFSVAHMNIKDPTVGASKRWPVLVSLRHTSKENVPVGSKVYVSQEIKNAITGRNA